MTCDECMKKVCGDTICQTTCDQPLLKISISLILYLADLLGLGLLKLDVGVNVNLSDTVKAALALVKSILSLL